MRNFYEETGIWVTVTNTQEDHPHSLHLDR